MLDHIYRVHKGVLSQLGGGGGASDPLDPSQHNYHCAGALQMCRPTYL